MIMFRNFKMVLNRDFKQYFDAFVPETTRAITFPVNLFISV